MIVIRHDDKVFQLEAKLNVIVYNPNFTSPGEISKIADQLSEHGIVIIALPSLNPKTVKLFEIQGVINQ